ncbi:hypothetical protein FGADI_10603 [Fusarium gaditjirri]|uniref:Nephrocystin 3-like N-terminal domain-containing protein n=1 Tax=Fusarium gaditjirri TaxID=282569 RepID=A0A8H4WR17_9HYPO|nr:hypothetical protein FGADI_10603 [Fusarium gaditjirri]
MELSLRDGSRLKPEIRLAQAVSEFEASLTSEQKVAFRASQSSAVQTAPTMSDVMRLTAEIDLKATNKHGRGRCFGPRMTNLLQAIQQFAALGDVVVGGSQNLIACGVWAAARMTVHSISWTRKSAFSRLSTSISDPDMKEFQSELEIWSSSIKEEADLLLNQKIDDESRENAKFRSLTTFLSESSSHQRRIKTCTRFLQACSQYDYQTTWKQTRKSGTTRLLESFPEYQQWQSDQSGHDSVLFRGKLGAGKSVLLANVVDDLNLQSNTIVLYFFARYDRPDALNARTILGSLIRQLLEHFVANRDFDHIFKSEASIRDADDVVEIFNQVPAHNRRVFIVLDGVDECPMEEQHALLRALSVIQPRGYKLCVSVRTLEQTSAWKDHSFRFNISIPEDNPDISDYVQVEVARRIQEGRLVIEDPNLVQEVKEKLISGACGMFLWVSLQLDSICAEMTDHAIREAIQNLPRDLTETFERNLAKASSSDTSGYHIRIFKLLVSVRELLTTGQLREATSVVVGQTTWDPAKQISRIERVLRFCGSLIMVDEEDETVRFIHHSARSFCLNSPNNTAAWTFTEEEAERTMAETLVTYLSYNIFDTRLSKNVVPKIEANDIPKRVALSTIKTSSVGKGIADRLLNLRSQLRHDVGPVLAESAKGYWKDDSREFSLLPYASKNWILHTSHVEYIDPLCRWYYLLHHPTFGIDLTDIPDGLPLRFSSTRPVYSMSIVWALSHGHLLLLRHEISKEPGARKIQSYVKFWILLRHIAPVFIKTHMEYRLVRWLSWMLVQLRITHPAKRPLLSRLSVFDEFYMEILRTAIGLSDIEGVICLLSRDNLGTSQLPSLSDALMDLAISYGNVPLLTLLMRKEFAVDSTATLFKIATSGMPEPIVAGFIRHLIRQNGLHLYSLPENVCYLAFRDPLRLLGPDRALGKLEIRLWRNSEGRRPKVDLLLHKACKRADLPMANLMISIGCDPNTYTDEGSCLDVALHGISKDRLNLVWHLLASSALPSYANLSRAVLLQQWAFVLYFLQLKTSFVDSSQMFDRPLLAPSFKIMVEDSDDIDYPFLVRTPTTDRYVDIVTALLPLPIIRSNSWEDWNFFFVTKFYRSDGWKPVLDSEEEVLCRDIVERSCLEHMAKIESRKRTLQESGVLESPKTFQTSIEFVTSLRALSPWIKLTTANGFSIIAEISRRWSWLPFIEPGQELNHTWAVGTTEESSHTMWDDSGRLHKPSLWMMQKTIDDLEKRCHNYGLLHDAAADGAWAVKELQRSYSLLQNLPSGSTLHTLDERVSLIDLPRFRLPDLSYFMAYSFIFAFMSVRIQWLRTLRILSVKGLLTKVRIRTETLQELGEMAMLMTGVLDVSQQSLQPPRHDYVMPKVLEAAFIGTESRDILQGLVASQSLWIMYVIAWIENMDTGIFTWSMGQDSPLSFRRAFQSFRDIGVDEEDIERLEKALETSRQRVSELE